MTQDTCGKPYLPTFLPWNATASTSSSGALDIQSSASIITSLSPSTISMMLTAQRARPDC